MEKIDVTDYLQKRPNYSKQLEALFDVDVVKFYGDLQRGLKISSVIDDPRLDWSGWAIGKPSAIELQQYLERTCPKRILEVGSGTSTVLFAEYASRHEAEVVSLGHDAKFQDQTSKLLSDFKLRDHVDLRLAPLEPYKCLDGCSYPWHATKLEGFYDFVFIDGPPMKYGRQAGYFALAPYLARNWELWLHDVARDHEKRCISLWKLYFSFDYQMSFSEPRGIAKLSPVFG